MSDADETSSATAHAKLLLFGEHAAVYGYPACGLSLAHSLRVTIAGPRSDGWSPAEGMAGRHTLLPDFLDFARDLFSDDVSQGGRISVETDIPEGVGFGSSAAWCAAFVTAVVGEALPLEARWKLAHRAEAFFHGAPSGIDTGLALLDGLFSFQPHPGTIPDAHKLPGFPQYLAVGAVPRRASTKESVTRLKLRVAAKDRPVVDAIDALGELSAHAVELLGGGSAGDAAARARRSLGELADTAQGLLRSLGLSTPELDAAIEAGRAAGALGGKLSGAGGGGAFYLVCENSAGAERVVAACARAAEAMAAEAGAAAVGTESEATLFTLTWVPQRAGR